MEKNEHVLRKLVIVIFVFLLLVFTGGVGYLFGTIFGSNNNKPSAVTNSDYEVLDTVKLYLQSEFYYGEDNKEYADKLLDDAIKGMVNAQNDPYTEYMTPDEIAEFLGSLESNFVGIGVRYKELDGNIFISDVINFSPAEKAGVQAGDFIVAVDGEKCVDHTIDEMADFIKGEQGTDVVVTIRRDNQEFDLKITRDVISSTVYSRMIGTTAILTITSFSDGTGEEVVKHLDQLEKNGAKDIIIDLRDNTGGYLSTLSKIADCFMDNKQIVMREVYRDGTTYDVKASGRNKHEYGTIILLVNEYSASCSEVFALAMKENVNAILVGETTFGKGVAQLTISLSNGGALKYTDCIWLSPSGKSVSEKGIEPDYKVRLHEALYLTYLILKEDETYSYDSVSENVKSAQMMLDFLGYQLDRQDGYYSAQTEKAITQFQKAKGIEETGVLDSVTANLLNSEVVYRFSYETDKYDTQLQKALEIIKENN